MKDAGRRAYVQRDRAAAAVATGERILDATVELFLEVPFPAVTLTAVAERSGVTAQTVIRRFTDKDGLVAAAAARTMTRVQAQRDPAPVGDVGGAVDNLVAHYELEARISLRLLAQEDSYPVIAAITQAAREVHRQWCARVFEPYLPLEGAERDRRLAQIVAVCDVYTWKILRRDSGLGIDQTTRSLVELLMPLTHPGGH